MKPEETSGQEANQRPTPLEYVGMAGCMIICLVPIVVVIGLVSWGTASLLHLHFHLPMWISIPLGLAVGVLFIGFLKIMENNTLIELSVTCAIFAVLAVILIPVFRQAREKALRQRQKVGRSAMVTSGGAHHAGPSFSTSNGTRR
jgi:hypothetical protein